MAFDHSRCSLVSCMVEAHGRSGERTEYVVRWQAGRQVRALSTSGCLNQVQSASAYNGSRFGSSLHSAQ